MSMEKPNEQQAGDPGKSLIKEVETLREQQVELTKAVRALCTLMSVLDRKVDASLKGGAGAGIGCM